MQIIVCGKREDWTPEKVEAERARMREADARYQPDPDEGWLSNWARGQSWHKLSLVADILAANGEGSHDEPAHCGQPLHEVKTQYGTLMLCAARCGFKVSYSTFANWRDKRGRRDLAAAGLSMMTLRYRLGITMNSNGFYQTVQERYAWHAGPTAGQMLGCR